MRTALETVFIGDGSKWIWNLARYHFPEAIQIVDWYHVEERIWDIGRALYGEGTKATDKWVQQQLRRLMKGRVEEIITTLLELSVPNPDVAEKVEDNVTYLTNNKDRMRYNEYEEKGSGVTQDQSDKGIDQLKVLISLSYKVL